MATDFDRFTRSFCTPTVQRLYEQFDQACAANDWEKADDILSRIQDASIAPPDYAFAPTESTRKH